jgi:hypothetical protein
LSASNNLYVPAGGISFAQIGDHQVRPNHIRDNRLSADDLAPNSVGSSELMAGAVTLDRAREAGALITIPVRTEKTTILGCITGIAVAAGWEFSAANDIFVTHSYPSPTSSSLWHLGFYNDNLVESATVQPYVVCLDTQT